MSLNKSDNFIVIVMLFEAVVDVAFEVVLKTCWSLTAVTVCCVCMFESLVS